MTTPRTGSRREPLARERVLAAAVELADQRGVEAVSMRKLAAHLGYEVMSLYNHVRNKTDLLEAMLDAVYAEVVPPATGLGWKQAVRVLAIDTHRALLRHPWAAPLIPVQFPGPHRFGHAEALLGLLASGGFDDDLRDLAYHAITLHIAGFTQQQLSYAATMQREDDLMARFEREVTTDHFPLMVDHARYHTERDASADERPDEFEFVLDLILDGIEQRDTRRRPRR